eukprot:2932527-Rhodomonas_salina.1
MGTPALTTELALSPAILCSPVIHVTAAILISPSPLFQRSQCPRERLLEDLIDVTEATVPSVSQKCCIAVSNLGVHVVYVQL